MKRVLLVIDNLGSGGAQNQLTLLAVGLRKKGYEVFVFVYHTEDFFKYRLTDYNIKIHLIKKSGKIGINIIWSLFNFVNKFDIEVVISFLDTPNFYSAIIKLLNPRIKFIASYRSMTIFSKLSFLKRIQYYFINSQADNIVSNSHHERKRWLSENPKLVSKWLTIYNMVDLKFENFDILYPPNKILVVGSISPDKNGLMVIEALKQLKDEGFDFELTWIGQKVFNIPERFEYLQKMESKINEYSLQEIWKWKDPIHNLQFEYCTHKLLLLASTVEGLPNVVCEALSMGIPCVVGDKLDNPILIEDKVNGLIFNLESLPTLVEAIKSVFSYSESELNEIRSRNIKKANSLFSEDNFLNSFIKLF